MKASVDSQSMTSLAVSHIKNYPIAYFSTEFGSMYTGGIINDPSEVGGWPELAAGTVPDDTDHDGMADEWEVLYRFCPDDPSDGPSDSDGDGYTNVEEYLNGTKPTTGSLSRRLISPFWSFNSPIFRALTVLAGSLAT